VSRNGFSAETASAGTPCDRAPELENLETIRAQREVSSGWRFGFWWIWILIIVGIWYVGFGWGTSGGWIWGRHHAAVQTTNDTELAGPGVAILGASNKLPYVGQAFVVENVPVEREAGPRAYWIGSRLNGVPMLAVNAANASANAGASMGNNPPHAAAGSLNRSANHQGAAAVPATIPHERLDVTGRILKAPAAAEAEQEWGLSPADAHQMETEGVYIQASAMQTAAQ
jgi:hypothetical protein